mmetsp:Transcript_163230/g.301382  ORF Transcript_163230/g.301382 Transcript_163230/m.301382 type:complete len:544 (+) Transcript_163230:106-1737(+)
MPRDWFTRGSSGHGGRRRDSRDTRRGHHSRDGRREDGRRDDGRRDGGDRRRGRSHDSRDRRRARDTTRRGGDRREYEDRGRGGGRRSHSRRRSRSRSRRHSRSGRRGKSARGNYHHRDDDHRRRKHASSSSSSSAKAKRNAGSERTPVKKRSPSSRHSKSNSSRGKDGDESGSCSDSNEDEIIHFDWRPDMMLNSRYRLTKLLGDGTFGRVVLAHDRKQNLEVAIKIIRDVKRYMENAKIEADILADIRKADPQGKSGCAIMYDTFTHESKFYCLVFEPLGVSLYDFLKDNDFRGFWLQDLQSFSRQCMEALRFLHDKLHMTHTDLKPENILLHSMQPAREDTFPRQAEWLRARGFPSNHNAGPYKRPVNSQIKIIDFGNATYANENHSSIINTRQYRSPEVLLSMGWNEVSDQWSIGCILMELYAGEQLFETHEELEHLALMERIIGALPQFMMTMAHRSVKEKYLTFQLETGRWRLPWPERSSGSSSERHVFSQRRLQDQVPPNHKSFVDFVADLLVLDPSARCSASRALEHQFLSECIKD